FSLYVKLDIPDNYNFGLEAPDLGPDGEWLSGGESLVFNRHLRCLPGPRSALRAPSLCSGSANLLKYRVGFVDFF
ncbi:MAG TPA: hypothetical protein VK518_22595, partial [Puia sp.]|nr:hypothetical protein [Puia sp.]